MPHGSESLEGPPAAHASGRYQLFVSYSGVDRARVEPFVRSLVDDGFVVYYDRRDPQPGSVIRQLADAIDASAHVVACLTAAYLRSQWPTFELENAAAADPAGDAARVIPVWFDRTGAEVPNYLRHIKYFDLSAPDPFGTAYRELVAAIRQRLANPAPPPDRKGAATIVDAAFGPVDDPAITLVRVRIATQEIVRQIHRRVLPGRPVDGTLDDLIDELNRAEAMPAEAAGPISVLRTFGRDALRDEAERGSVLTAEAITPALTALRRLRDSEFPERHTEDPIRPAAPAHRDLRRLGVIAATARAAWPLGGDEVLVSDERTGALRTVRGDDVRWQDTERVTVRRVVTGPDGRLAVGGWEGAIRYFVTGPEPVAAVTMDGTVGDLRLSRTGLIAGSWKQALWRIGDAGERHVLTAVQGGVHRIAVPDRGDRFAVAELSGRLDFYDGDRPGRPVPAAGPLADIAYAGTRLVLLGDETVAGLRLDGVRGEPVPFPGAVALLPHADRGQCLLVVTERPAGAPPRTRLLIVDEADRHIPYVTLPPGDELVSADAGGRRLVTRRPGGCAYWRDGTELMVWPAATAAAVSGDGRRIAVCGPGQVELYEDRG
jgi:hypothetical protein